LLKMLLMCVSTACSVGDGEAVGDGAVGAASGHQGEDVMLAGGECAEGTGVTARVQQAGDHLGVQGGAAGRDPRDRVGELRDVGDPVLEQGNCASGACQPTGRRKCLRGR
jgi:hypothetical protein